MRINEVCTKIGLTKKAISYYEKQGLISPEKGDNNYRDYTEDEVRLLEEIALYRKLDISIKDIKTILNSDNRSAMLNKIISDKHRKIARIKMQQKYIERLLKSNFNDNEIQLLNEEISNEEKENGQFIKNELRRSFPGGLGAFLSKHFEPYLNEPIDSAEKYNAWLNIVEFLDNIEDIQVPKLIQSYYGNMEEETLEQINDSGKNEILKLLKAEGQELEEFKKKILDHVNETNNNPMSDFMKSFNELKKEMNSFFSCSGYYDIFIPNMKVLSKDYREYQDSLVALNERLTKELGIKYDEDMKIVKISDI